MNTFIKDTETGEIYYFDLYEKWWYCFFLYFATFLPHHCRKVNSIEDFEKIKKTKSKEVDEKKMLGCMIGGLFLWNMLSAILSSSKFYSQGVKGIYFVLTVLVVYFVMVVSAYFINRACRKRINLELFDPTEIKKVIFRGIKFKNKKQFAEVALVQMCIVFTCILIINTISNGGSLEIIVVCLGGIFIAMPMFTYIFIAVGVYRNEDGSKYIHCPFM